MESLPPLEAKVVVLGERGVGKTCLVLRYIEGAFSAETSSTVGAFFLTKKLTVAQRKVKLQIWDTAGQERFRSMAPMYYRGAQAAVLVFDITSEKSFQNVRDWVDELQRNCSESLVLAIAANKVRARPARTAGRRRCRSAPRRSLADAGGRHVTAAPTPTPPRCHAAAPPR